MNDIKLYSPFLVFLLLSSALRTGAQPLRTGAQPLHTNEPPRDSLAGYRTFLQICNGYQRSPMQLQLVLSNSSNRIDSEADTLEAHVNYFINGKRSYADFGEVEQLADDSLVLLVNRQVRRMILYSNNYNRADRMRQAMGFSPADSSLRRIAANYSIQTGASPGGAGATPGGDTAVLELSSRALLPFTSLPKETVQVVYATAESRPYRVVQTRLSQLPVDKETYQELAGKREWRGKCGVYPDSSFFIVKEKTMTFRYLKLAHDADAVLPAAIGDRIRRDSRGGYQPVAAYKDFILTQNR